MQIKKFYWKFNDGIKVEYFYNTVSLDDLLRTKIKYKELLNFKGSEAERKAKRKSRQVIRDLLKMIGDDLIENYYEIELPSNIGSLKIKDTSEIDTKINQHLYKFDIRTMGAYPDLFFKVNPKLQKSINFFDSDKNYVGHLTDKLRQRAIQNMINGYKYP